MKYYYRILFICILLNSFLSYAGDKNNLPPTLKTTLTNRAGQLDLQKSSSPFYTEDFANGLPSGWQAIDNAGVGVNWHFTNTGTFNTAYDSLSVIGTSAANGYMIYDSDSANATFGGENADLISISINCSLHPNVRLSFNEYLIHYNDTATVLVSNNGNSWTEFHNSSAGLDQQSGTSNPHHVDFDISSVAANQPTVYIRFNYKANFSYFWMIDDVQLYEAPAKDCSLSNIISPVSDCNLLSASEPVTVTVYNNGGETINGGFDLTFIADNNVFPVTESITDTIVVGSSVNYTFSGAADFSAPGNHSISVYINFTGDTIHTNDTISSDFRSGPQSINTTNDYSIGFENENELSGFTIEDNNTDSISWSISNIFPNSGTYCAQISGVAADDWYFTNCLDLDSTIVYNLEYYYRTSSTSTQANFHVMLGPAPSSSGMTQEIVPTSLITNIFYQVSSNQFSVNNSGTYYLGLHVQNSDSLVGFRIDDLKIRSDSGVGISKINSIVFSVYPNPSSGIINIQSKENSKTGFKIEILNQTGKVIYSNWVDQLTNYKIDFRDQGTGIYLLRIFSENGIIIKKISVID